ncbi:MAG: PAS domain S-box protein [Proteobacteria bacterium]|nr:PAS domain S-box protein [Pseudomonadota bacterium]
MPQRTLIEEAGVLNALAGIADDAIIVVDEDLRILFFNAGAERIFGYTLANVREMTLDALMPERFRAGHRAHMRRFAESGATSRPMGSRTVIQALRANGQEFPAEASIAQISTAGRRFACVILRDVTELVAARAEVEKLRDLIPVCAWCGRMRGDTGYWQSVNEYFAEHPRISLTHGICKECAARATAEIEKPRPPS